MVRRRYSLQEAYEVLFKGKSESGLVQFFRYIFVGGFSALADIGTLFFAVSILGIHYLVSAAIAFLVGNVVNYFLSVAWVFHSSGQIKKELLLFTAIGFGGLILNELIIWIAVEFFEINYLMAKLISVSLVVIYSFSLRRMMLMKLNNKTLADEHKKA